MFLAVYCERTTIFSNDVGWVGRLLYQAIFQFPYWKAISFDHFHSLLKTPLAVNTVIINQLFSPHCHESVGREFESLQARQQKQGVKEMACSPFFSHCP